MLTAIAPGMFAVKGSLSDARVICTAHELGGLAAAVLDALCCAQPSGTAPVMFRQYAGPDVQLRPAESGNSAEDRFCFGGLDWSRAEAVELVNRLYMVGLPAYVAPPFPAADIPVLLGEATSEEVLTEEVKEATPEEKPKAKKPKTTKVKPKED
jgi:hypothetical protein